MLPRFAAQTQVRSVDGHELGRAAADWEVTVAVCSHSGASRHALLEEEVAVDPVDPALEHRRALAHAEQDGRRRTVR